MSESIPIKEAVALATPFIKSVVDVFITPKLEKLKTKMGLRYKRDVTPTNDHFTEYFARSYKRFSIVNTLILNNSEKLLKDVYIPLGLNFRINYPFKERYSWNTILDSSYINVLVTDIAGMGKSTLIKRIFLDVIDRSLGIPILVELRRLKNGKTILSEIKEQLNAINKDFDETLLLEIIAQGDFIFFLDGYDEIPIQERERVTQNIQDFIAKAGANKFFLTSRPEAALTSFGNFQQFTIQPLNEECAFELLRKYDNYGTVSELLTATLKGSDINNIREFLTNPLLVSLLFTAFQHKQKIPFEKHLFYRQVYDALFESHDLTKGDSYMHEKYSKLNVDDFHRVLRRIGYDCMKGFRLEFSKDEILNFIAESKVFCRNLSFSESDFLKDLISTVPLFIQDGIYYRWAHKSLQEYFATQFIYLDAKEKQTAILENIFNSPVVDKYENLLDLYCNIDFNTFEHVITCNLLKQYKEYATGFIKKLDDVVEWDDLIRRIELSFLTRTYYFKGPAKSLLDQNKYLAFVGKVSEQADDQYSNPSSVVASIEGTNNYLYFFNIVHRKYFLLSFFCRKKSAFVDFVQSSPGSNLMVSNVLDLETMYDGKLLANDSEYAINRAETFAAINKVLQQVRGDCFVINHDKALIALQAIEEDVALRSKDDFLLEGF